MILAFAAIVGFAICLARYRGNAFRQIAAIPLHSAWLALLALVLQWPLLREPAGPVQGMRVQQALFLLSHVLLLAFVWQNRQLSGIQVVGLGVMCNLLVIAANGGFMPVTPETLTRLNPGSTLVQWLIGTHYGYSKDVILLQGQTRLWALSDALVIPPPFPRPAAFSLGDLFIAIGTVIVLQGTGNSRPTASR